VRARHRPLVAAAVAPGAEYGADLLAAAWPIVRATHARAALCLYGPPVPEPALAQPGVHQLGALDRAQSLGVIEAADLFLRPTRADGDAISVREALALGRRVVASDACPRPRGVAVHRAGDAHDLATCALAALEREPPRVLVGQARATLLAIYARCGLEPNAPPTPRLALSEGLCAASPAA
jgi:glycosyltransferase involved in cell wall biosynthesis